jgi:hypothetical protein
MIEAVSQIHARTEIVGFALEIKEVGPQCLKDGAVPDRATRVTEAVENWKDWGGTTQQRSATIMSERFVQLAHSEQMMVEICQERCWSECWQMANCELRTLNSLRHASAPKKKARTVSNSWRCQRAFCDN